MPVGFRKGSPQQRTRFAPSRVSAAWQKVVSHLTPPSQPSTTSQSAIDSTFNHTDLYYNESLNITVQHLDLLNPKSGTHDRHKRMGFRRKGVKSSQANSNSRFGDDEDPGQPNEPVSHIVVDADFDHSPRPPPSQTQILTVRHLMRVQPTRSKQHRAGVTSASRKRKQMMMTKRGTGQIGVMRRA